MQDKEESYARLKEWKEDRSVEKTNGKLLMRRLFVLFFSIQIRISQQRNTQDTA